MVCSVLQGCLRIPRKPIGNFFFSLSVNYEKLFFSFSFLIQVDFHTEEDMPHTYSALFFSNIQLFHHLGSTYNPVIFCYEEVLNCTKRPYLETSVPVIHLKEY